LTYAVAPCRLLVVWNTPGGGQDGIYDACICISCAKMPNIDVCKLGSFQTLVAKDVIPGESTAGMQLGSGSIRTLLDEPGILQINTPDLAHWAASLGAPHGRS
jgi:hypothetical protein